MLKIRTNHPLNSRFRMSEGSAEGEPLRGVVVGGEQADAVGGARTTRLCAPRTSETQTPPLTSPPVCHGGHVAVKVEACG